MTIGLATKEGWARWLDHPEHADVPPPPHSLSVLCKLLADRAIIHGMAATAPAFWGMADRLDPEIRHELRDTLALHHKRGWDIDPGAFHREPPLLDEARFSAGSVGGQPFEHLRFESAYAPDPDDPGASRWLTYGANRTAHAWVLRHSSAPGAPWIVSIHAFMMGHTWMDLHAFRARELHDDHGVNVLCYVMPLHGPRRGNASVFEPFLAGVGNLIQMEAQAIWDLRRILAWLRSEGAEWIGVHGISLGGYTAALLATLEPDLAFAIAGIPAVDFSALLQSHTDADRRPQHTREVWDDVTRALRVVSPLSRPARIPKDRRFIFAGLVDRMALPRSVRQLWLHWDRPRIEWYPGSHVSFFIEPRIRSLVREAILLAKRESAERRDP